MNITVSAAPVHHSFRDRVGLIFARAIQAALFGFAPFVIVGWVLLAGIVLPIVLFVVLAVPPMVMMGVTGQWALDPLGGMLFAILVRSLVLLAVFVVVLWSNDMVIYSFNPRLPRDPRERHGR